MGRPLLFSSFDPLMAEARGLPVRLLASLFLVLVAVTVSIAMQVIGVLLVFALLVGPPATAIRLVHRPASVMLLSIILGLIYTWLGIFLAANSSWPVSFYITTLSFGVYLPVRLILKRRKGRQNRLEKMPVSFTMQNSEAVVEPDGKPARLIHTDEGAASCLNYFNMSLSATLSWQAAWWPSFPA